MDDLSLSSGVNFGFIQGFENTRSNRVGCTKTNHVNVAQFAHVEPMYAFELSQFNNLLFFFPLHCVELKTT